MTEKQESFLQSLIRTREVPAEYREVLEHLDFSTIPTQNASRLIDELLRLPVKARAAAPVQTDTVDVPAGRYAVTVDGEVKFYRVDRPTEGKWAGFTFVKVQASDEFWPVRGQAAKAAVLAAIAADPGALARYGQLLGTCGICGRTLTDQESRERGIGPVCLEKAA